MRTPTHRSIGLFLVVLAVLLAPAAQAAGFQERASLDTRRLVVRNVIGEVSIVAASDGRFEIEVRVEGRDADRELIQVEIKRGAESAVNVVFPLDRHRDYVYPRLQRGGSSSFSMRRYDGSGDQGFWGKLFGWRRERIHVAGRGSGMEMWADIKIAVPRGGELVIEHGAGQIVADGASGNLNLGIAAGQIEATGLRGTIVLDSGSGSIDAEDVTGDLSIDTGSGSVRVSRCEGDRILVDTGSGSVTAEDLVARTLLIDTGSGGVEARSVQADEAVIDTGSGSVELELVRMGSGPFKIDTGSGQIRLAVPDGVSADVSAETGSGGIHVDLDGVRLRHKERGEMDFTVGDGGARVVLDTGSGSIRIARAADRR